MRENIVIKGARENNLKDIDVTIPRDNLVVFTGLSGSGKSSLAFDTLYAEGQRRYVESLSSYARMFLGQMEKPDVDSIEGLSPAISIDQKTTSKNPRSTVGTVTEIYDYMRLLYARIGIPHCPVCGKEIKQQTVDQIVDKVLELPENEKIQILAPIVRGRKGEYKKELESAKKSGFVRVRVDGNIYDLSEEISMEKNKKHNIEIIVDRLKINSNIKSRLADSIETASSLSDGLVLVDVIDGDELLFSQNYACPEHGASFDELAPRMFSFNNPFGACPECTGLGNFLKVDPELVVPDPSLPISKEAIKATGWSKLKDMSIAKMYYKGLAKHYKFSLDTPFGELPKKIQDIIFYGTNGEKIELDRKYCYGVGKYMVDFEGVCNSLERRYKESGSDYAKFDIENYMTEVPCPKCNGKRLSPQALAVTVGGKNIMELCDMSVKNLLKFVDSLELTGREKLIGDGILKEIKERLGFLNSVGLHYLTLSRSSGTLSGGEAQRIRLATQIGSSLMGVLYILDEPSIGLHQRDNDKLLATLKKLRDLGNTLVVVEHDEDTMRAADYLVDIGPGPGDQGGEVVAAGTPEEVMRNKNSLTGKYLTGEFKIDVPKKRRKGNGKFIEIKGASQNNLKNINVKFPLGTMTLVTGVSGSGKSSLVTETLVRALRAKVYGTMVIPGKNKGIKGLENVDKVVDISQEPIGRTPRSNPATYVGVFDDIRDLFAEMKESKMKGYDKGRFSFNVKGGRCEACQGDGIKKIEMHFLPDVYVPCDVCHGTRYNRETLDVKFKGKNIAEVLDMRVSEAIEFFDSVPKIKNKLQTMIDVGLPYIKLGQSAPTLSGGEAARVKLAKELQKKPTGKSVFILDEPTTGLHTDDIKKLLVVLERIVDNGDTVIIIEHNLDVIKCADYIIDIGPNGGDDGGKVIAKGTPEEIVKVKESFTGEYLKSKLEEK